MLASKGSTAATVTCDTLSGKRQFAGPPAVSGWYVARKRWIERFSASTFASGCLHTRGKHQLTGRSVVYRWLSSHRARA
jgi:hypothetical protein